MSSPPLTTTMPTRPAPHLLSALFIAALLISPLSSALAEFRGAWVPTVFNLTFPSKQGLSPEAQKAEIRRIVDTAARCGINHLFVQVRPECDALYPSKIEPWSRFLTGIQGRDPGYDPLATFIAEGRRRNIAIHAWINPYRAAVNASHSRAGNHIAHRQPSIIRRSGNLLLLDPGSPAAQDRIITVVRDILRRYPVAGIHFDDYFYPYPSAGGKNFPDSATYEAYRRSGGRLSLADWRRENVNTLIRRTYQAVKAERPTALFGVSPFGIYTKGQPPTVKAGLDQYNELYADPVRWMREGWVDYLAPQLYWREGGPQSFSALLHWWRSPQVNPRGVPIYPGIAVDRMGSHGWPAEEIATQIRLERTILPRRGGGGYILWSMKPLLTGSKKIDRVLASLNR